MSKAEKLLLVITGMPGAGKTTLAKIAKKLGFRVFSFGSIIRREVKRRGLKMTRENIEKISLWFHQKDRDKTLAKLLAKEIERSRNKLIVVDGSRSPGEIEVLKRHFGKDSVILLAVTASKRLRYKRMLERKRLDTRSVEVIKARDERELGYGLGELIKMADYKIKNDSTIEKLEEKFKKTLGKIARRKDLREPIRLELRKVLEARPEI